MPTNSFFLYTLQSHYTIDQGSKASRWYSPRQDKNLGHLAYQNFELSLDY